MQAVIAAFPIQRVVPRFAIEDVIARAGVGRRAGRTAAVILGAVAVAIDDVIALAAPDRVAAGPCIDLVIPRARQHRVVAIPGQHDIVLRGLAGQQRVGIVDEIAFGVVRIGRVDQIPGQRAFDQAVAGQLRLVVFVVDAIEGKFRQADRARAAAAVTVRMDHLNRGNRAGDGHCHAVRGTGPVHAGIDVAAPFDGVAVDLMVRSEVREGHRQHIAFGVLGDDRHPVIPAPARIDVIDGKGHILDRLGEVDIGFRRVAARR